MSKTLYLVRHCQSYGQAPDAPLTIEGERQALALADWLGSLGIERLVSSTYKRAYQSFEPLADRLGLTINTDERLVEQTLSSLPLDDWRDRLAESFVDLDLCLEGGESSRTATNRAIAAIDDTLKYDVEITAIATHGKLLTLILKHFDNCFGYTEWENLTNPDVFQLQFWESSPKIQRWSAQET
ncbi:MULTISPECIES: histidine phosphatase family protein [Pseudanabaena]|uniref:Phosphoglycerate mutase n=2 Tax=Pseudanabaena TaxID=1152 RepID=L8N8N8_9CYAN|nr:MULTISPECIES: histidine phosphatase family protein [Pseudanabaena]ELS34593.1 Phosphoglycerate mutase [Pseudanabaena biceps PCC 7429]MDG3493198.1 histidine phosphatase family protein [Pseudanabaena catenata USMAC16]